MTRPSELFPNPRSAPPGQAPIDWPPGVPKEPRRGGNPVGCVVLTIGILAGLLAAYWLGTWAASSPLDQPALAPEPTPAPTAYGFQYRATDRPMSCWIAVGEKGHVSFGPCFRDMEEE